MLLRGGLCPTKQSPTREEIASPSFDYAATPPRLVGAGDKQRLRSHRPDALSGGRLAMTNKKPLEMRGDTRSAYHLSSPGHVLGPPKLAPSLAISFEQLAVRLLTANC
jgi:hypothetical protein